MELCERHKRPLDKNGRCPICDNPFTHDLWSLVHKDNRNALIVVEGPPGTGKSYWCLKVAQYMDPGFFENPKITVQDLSTRIIFKPSDFVKVLSDHGERNTLYKGAVLIVEEGGVQADHRKWYSFNNMVYNYIFQTFRFMNLIVILNVPVIDYVDSDAQKLFNYHVKTLRITSENMNKVEIFQPQYNSIMKRIYRKHLRYKVNNQWIKFRTWSFPKASARLLHEYEKMHTSFKSGLIDELAEQMIMLDKQVAAKKNQALVDEKKAALAIADNPDGYVSFRAGRLIVDKARVEMDYKIGRSIAERIKKRAEMILEERGYSENK